MTTIGGAFALAPQRRWLVLFFDPDAPLRWWDRFTRPGFRHVCLLAYVPTPAYWLHLDYGRDGSTCCLLPAEEGHRLIGRVRANGGTILEWLAPTPRPSQRLLHLPHCVSFAQRFLGLTGWFWTPWQLALCLERRGAAPMFGSPPPSADRTHVRKLQPAAASTTPRSQGHPGGH